MADGATLVADGCQAPECDGERGALVSPEEERETERGVGGKPRRERRNGEAVSEVEIAAGYWRAPGERGAR